MHEESKCPDCGTKFDNVFEEVNHLAEDGEEFDPALILPSGVRLLVGSLLMCIYEHAHDAETIRSVAESTYRTLYTAETAPKELNSILEEIIVNSNMMDIDKELKELLRDEKKHDG